MTAVKEAPKRLRVAYWGPIPSPYMVARFAAVAARDTMDFEAWFNERRTPDRSWTVDEAGWAFDARYLPRRRWRGAPVPVIGRALDEFQPDLLVLLHSGLEYFIGWEQARRRKVATAFRILPPSPTWFGRRWEKELIKKYMFQRVDGLFVSGTDAADYVRQLGADSRRIFDHPQVVDVARFAAVAEPDRPSVERRSALGLTGVVFIYVGRLWWGKGVDVLIDAARMARAAGVDLSVLIVGDGPDENALRARAADLEPATVHFAGFKEGGALLDLLGSSDAFVFPTLGDPYGLVVDEAMAAGLPVISSDAAGEIRSRVIDDVTGIVVRAGDAGALADAMVAMARDREGRSRMGASAARSMAGRTPAFFAERFDDAVAGTLGLSIRPPGRARRDSAR